MKTKFKFFGLLITVCVVICAAFAGCLTTADYEEIYNDDAKIASSSSSRSMGEVQTSVNGKYELSCASFSGVKIIINSFTVNENTSATVSFEVTEGKCKLVLVKDKTVYTLIDNSDSDGALDLSAIPAGNYKVKLVGVDAQIKLKLNY